MMGKMISHNLFSTIISVSIYYLMIPLTLSSQSSTALQAAQGTSDLLDLIKTEFGKQNHRIALLETQNRNQDEDIGLLKIDNLKIHDQIDLINVEALNEIISNNDTESSSYTNDDNSVKAPTSKKQYQKRAARLFPVKLLFNGKGVVPTVPFNCSDLNQMGHTVNGIYLVKRRKDDSSGVNVVLCDFQPPVVKKSSSLPVTENRLGFLNLKSSNSAPSKGIYFYVQRGNGPTMKDGVIRFHKEQLNIGKAMSISTGIFTVPKAGIYYFSFSILKEGLTFPALHIYFRVNQVKIGLAIVSPGLITATATFQSTLKLKKGDRVDVWKPNSGTLCECMVLGGNAIEPPCHHFTGWLLEEELN